MLTSAARRRGQTRPCSRQWLVSQSSKTCFFVPVLTLQIVAASGAASATFYPTSRVLGSSLQVATGVSARPFIHLELRVHKVASGTTTIIASPFTHESHVTSLASRKSSSSSRRRLALSFGPKVQKPRFCRPIRTQGRVRRTRVLVHSQTSSLALMPSTVRLVPIFRVLQILQAYLARSDTFRVADTI